MSDQYLYHEGGSRFHEGHDGQVIYNRGAGIVEPPLSEAENETTYFTDFSNMSGQIPFSEDESSFAGNGSGNLFDIPNSWIPSSQPEYHTQFSMDCSGSGLNPHPEGISSESFTTNVRDHVYTLDAPATLNHGEYDETRRPKDPSNHDQNYHFGDGWSFSGGAGEQFSYASGAKILDNAAYNGNAPLYPNMIPQSMPQSAVGPQSGYNWQPRDAPQSGDSCSIGPFDSDQTNASPPQPREHRPTQSGDDDNIRPPEQDQSNKSPSQPQQKPGKRWSKAEDGKLLKRLQNRMDLEQVAEELHRTVDSCRGRRRRLDALSKSEIEALIKAYEDVEAAARAPRDVPTLYI